MVTKPKTAQHAAAALQLQGRTPAKATPKKKTARAVGDDGIQQWDAYIADAEPDVEPWRMRLPDGELLEVGCPDSDTVEAVTLHMLQGNTNAIFETLFGEEHAETLLNLTAKKAFTARPKLVNDVLTHFNINSADLPESDASST